MFDSLRSMKVTVPIVLLAGLFWLGYRVDDMTVSTLSEWFVTKAQAQVASQELSSKIAAIENQVAGVIKKVDDVEDKVDSQRVAAIEQEVFGLRTQQCMASGTEFGTAILSRITTLISEWRMLTGSAGNPPTYFNCDDL